MKNKKGITLIALIITIIVLLILAGVSISILTGENGVLTQAQESSEKTKQAKLQELHDLTASSAAMNLEGYIYTDRTGKKVYIPSGFEVSQVTREVGEMKNGKLLVENEVDSGLVIIDKYGDEFVWIPATNVNYVKRISKGWNFGSDVTADELEDDYGTGYFITNSSKERETIVDAGGFFVSRYEIGLDGTEQRNLTNVSDISYYSKVDVANNYVYTAIEKELYWSQANDSQKRAIIDRILPQLQSKKGIEPVRRMTQDECLWLANEWKSGKDYQSGLITGTQWDRMVSWICDAGENNAFEDGTDKPLGNCTSWGNYRNTLSTTYKLIFTSGVPVGNNEELWGQWIKRTNGWSRNGEGNNYKFVFPTGEFITDSGRDTRMKNVYDVAGNVWEWTTEVSQYVGTAPNYANRVLRGGSVDNAGSGHPATCRNGENSGKLSAPWTVGFRVVLYVIPLEK